MALTNTSDEKRHQDFKQLVDRLKAAGSMRFYTSLIKERTGEDTGNISKYYRGEKPIGDNFFNKFKEAFKSEIAKLPKKYKHDGSAQELNDSSKNAYNKGLTPIKKRLSALEETMRELKEEVESIKKGRQK